MASKHFEIGAKCEHTTTMGNTTFSYEVMEIVKKRPYTYRVHVTVDEHLSFMAQRLRHTSGQSEYDKIMTETVLMDTFGLIKPKKAKKVSQVPVSDSDREYWNYLQSATYKEKVKGADYFDVTPSAFDDDYDTAMS